MQKWLRRIRGALGMGFLWAVGWAVVGGGIMEGFLDRAGAILDMWPQTLGIAGFVGGAAFSILFGIAARHRSFEELSLVRFGVLGAVAVAVGAFLMTTGAPVLIMAPAALLCAGSASGSLALGRRAKERELLDAGSQV